MCMSVSCCPYGEGGVSAYRKSNTVEGRFALFFGGGYWLKWLVLVGGWLGGGWGLVGITYCNNHPLESIGYVICC